jgi:nitrite reductase (NADH) large subunit
VESLLKASLAEAFQKAAAAGLCKCTSLTHEEVRRSIKEEHLLTIPSVMSALGLRRPDGCASCRP